jgi:hypothetical protein
MRSRINISVPIILGFAADSRSEEGASNLSCSGGGMSALGQKQT